MKTSEKFFEQMDEWTKERIPYFFLIDYKTEKPFICKLEEVEENNIKFHFPHFPHLNSIGQEVVLTKYPITFECYKEQFDKAIDLMKKEDVSLLNLTFETAIDVNVSLGNIFEQVSAKYKVLYKNEFVCFSPEIFVRVENNQITSYPMKGTIDASLPNAESIILNSKKEKAEHASAVDLLCNDLLTVADRVEVKRYRYIDSITTKGKKLLQVSSEIEGVVKASYHERYGTLIKQLLPGGSIAGAPKPEAMSIIGRCETHNRGYYSGVCGIFDGTVLDSCVLIRYIEQRDGSYFYKSGGGITNQSRVESEYQEMIDKIYVPMD